MCKSWKRLVLGVFFKFFFCFSGWMGYLLYIYWDRTRIRFEDVGEGDYGFIFILLSFSILEYLIGDINLVDVCMCWSLEERVV